MVSLFRVYINNLTLHIPSNSAECHMLAYDTTLHTTGKSLKSITQIKIKKKKQLCLHYIWMWCNANHMLINPVKTESMLINTWQKHQLSDLSLRLSLDGQNIQNATELHPLGLIADNKFWWQAQMASPDPTHMQNHVKPRWQAQMASPDPTHMQNHVHGKPRWQAQIRHICKIMSKKKCFSFLHCNIIIININTRKIFYNAHIKPNTDYVSAVWDGCSEENFKKYLTLYIKGQAN